MAVMDLKGLCVKLNYKFRNIVLLHEALTHKLEETEENEYFSPFPGVLYQQKDHGRLRTLGARVFEMLIVDEAFNQFVVQNVKNAELPENERKAIKDIRSFKIALLNPKYFQVVGERLSLWECIKTTNQFRDKIEALYEPVIKAILGAIFIDSGGCYGRVGSKVNPLEETKKVFYHLWRPTKSKGKATGPNLKDPIGVDDFMVFQLEGMNKSWDNCVRANKYKVKLDYKFQKKWVLEKTLTVHPPENEPFFDIMRVVGQAVWELVICEYLYWFYIDDDQQTHFKEGTIRFYSKVAFYEAIANAINLKDDLMPKGSGEKAVLHVFMKKLIGAIYMDSEASLASTKKSIVHLCESNREKIAKMMQKPLPHSTKTYLGIYYRGMDKYCWLVTHGPPKPQESFKITNVSEFMKVNDSCKFEVKADHVDQMAVAKEEEELDSKRILICSEDQCNQLEYERVSLYHTLNRMGPDIISPNGDVLMPDHSNGKCLYNRKDANVNLDFWVVLKILFLWMFMLLVVFKKILKWVGWILWNILEAFIIFSLVYIAYKLVKKIIEGLIWIEDWIINDPQANILAEMII